MLCIPAPAWVEHSWVKCTILLMNEHRATLSLCTSWWLTFLSYSRCTVVYKPNMLCLLYHQELHFTWYQQIDCLFHGKLTCADLGLDLCVYGISTLVTNYTLDKVQSLHRMLCIALPYRQTSHIREGAGLGMAPGPQDWPSAGLVWAGFTWCWITTLHGITVDVEGLPDALGVLALGSNIRFEHIAPTLLCSVLTTACLWASGWTWRLGSGHGLCGWLTCTLLLRWSRLSPAGARHGRYGSLPADSTYTANSSTVYWFPLHWEAPRTHALLKLGVLHRPRFLHVGLPGPQSGVCA